VDGGGNGAGSLDALLAELLEERRLFDGALAAADPALLTAPGLLGEWSARELIAHMGYWAGHAAEAIHHAAQGRLADFEAGEIPSVDERNSIVARVAAETDLPTVRQREQAAFDALVDAMRNADDAWLPERTGDGTTLERLLREDGPEHYNEHTAHLRAWFGGPDEDDEPDDDGADVEDRPG
jgi:mycothiol maleylpyruvate isomerase-like protein